MRAPRSALLAAFAAVLGCAASSPPPPPPAPAYAVRSSDMPVAARWEQFCEQATSVPQASWLASTRGADGWELVSMYNGVLCYKRPQPTQPPAVVPAQPAMPPQQVVVERAPLPPLQPGPVTSAGVSPVPKIIDPGF